MKTCTFDLMYAYISFDSAHGILMAGGIYAHFSVDLGSSSSDSTSTYPFHIHDQFETLFFSFILFFVSCSMSAQLFSIVHPVSLQVVFSLFYVN